jgi:hypothetical protein
MIRVPDIWKKEYQAGDQKEHTANHAPEIPPASDDKADGRDNEQQPAENIDVACAHDELLIKRRSATNLRPVLIANVVV